MVDKCFAESKVKFVPLPFLGNHKQIILETDHPDVREYRYYEKKSRGLDYQGMLEDLKVQRTTLQK